MDCFNCNNCKENQPTYYCLSKNEIVINEKYQPSEKIRAGWKKGTRNYEINRRNARNDSELV
ncbi:MAG: hypothetical protein FH751_00660 [Firmicutes bacterium]|nr:hypothetical protein [Bacillota bacterium]